MSKIDLDPNHDGPYCLEGYEDEVEIEWRGGFTAAQLERVMGKPGFSWLREVWKVSTSKFETMRAVHIAYGMRVSLCRIGLQNLSRNSEACA